MNTIRGLAISALLVASHALRAEDGDVARFKEQFYQMAMAELKTAKSEYDRWCALSEAAKASLDQGKDADAKSFAEELERITPKYPKDWNYGNAVHDANIVLGRLALKAGDVEAAKKRLIAAGHTKGSPQLDSFGPDLNLAKELLAKKEKATVLEYLTLCGKFWEGKEPLIAYWKKEIEKGRTPSFDESEATIPQEGRPKAGPKGGAGPELAMRTGMTITAETKTGTIAITASKGLKRTYTWEGASRTSELDARTERWYGSLGAYEPAMGEPWAEHHGVTRGVVEEGQQHFASEKAALKWLREQAGYYPTVYRDDGLVVSFGKVLERKQINVDVWQIDINGKKPTKLEGSENDKIKVSVEKAR